MFPQHSIFRWRTMDQQDLRTLQILEEIEKNKQTSQRDLARKLNISLGLVNSFIKRLAAKGYFKVSTIPKNRVKYILTPKGMAEKSRLTYEYIVVSYQYYKEARRKLKTLFQDLSADGVKRIVFFGVSEFAELAYLSMKEAPIDMVGVIDDDKTGEKFLGEMVMDSDMLNSLAFDKVLITACATEPEAFEKMKTNGVSPHQIVRI